MHLQCNGLLTDQFTDLLTDWLNASAIDCAASWRICTHTHSHMEACSRANDRFARATMSKIYGFHLMPKMNGQVNFCVISWRLAAVSPFVHKAACAHKVDQRWREVGVVATLTTETVALTAKLHINHRTEAKCGRSSWGGHCSRSSSVRQLEQPQEVWADVVK